tara:strand:+ start:5860 stop:6549 length:690 start_codon:yes stop_codon:yes gene_type:complete
MKRIRVQKKKNFTVVNNQFIFEKGLSLKSKGLLVWMLALPENWELYVENVIKHHTDGKTAIYSAFKELMSFNYLERKQIRDKKGKIISWEYVVHECPLSGNQEVGYQQVDKQLQGNQSLIKTTKNNTIKYLSLESIKSDFQDLNFDAWTLWKEFRKEQFRSSYKSIGERSAIKKLIELSKGDQKIQADIIEQSISNGWRGLFALKQEQKSNVKQLQSNWLEARKIISNE